MWGDLPGLGIQGLCAANLYFSAAGMDSRLQNFAAWVYTTNSILGSSAPWKPAGNWIYY